MAIKIFDKYSPRANAPDANYPLGSIKNESVPDANDGTPLDQDWGNDFEGFKQSALSRAGVTANGTADSLTNPQILDAVISSAVKETSSPDLLSNAGFDRATPDDSQPQPDATPRDYMDGHQVFLGWFVDTGIIGLTYTNGIANATTGAIYQDVPITGKLEFITQFTASCAMSDGAPFSDYITFTKVGDVYRVRVDLGASSGVFSAKFEEGTKATRHVSYHDDGSRFGVINASDFVVGGGVLDDTPGMIDISKSAFSGCTIDLNGLTIRIKNQGSNFNPIRPTQDPNQTCYFLFEKLDNITIRNGEIIADLDMSTECLVIAGFAGCKGVTLDNVGMTINATGIPSFTANGYETFASLVSFKHHYDDTEASDLIIKNNCRFKIFHPNGGNIGDKETNPVHDYSGKLVGVNFYGNVSESDQPSPDKPIYGLTIRDCFFTNCTARVVWCWGAYSVRICDNSFVNIGLNATAFANYVIRMTHWGDDVIISGNRIRNGYFHTCGILVSNNNSPRTPKNVSVYNNSFDSSEGLHILLNAGINVSIKANKFLNVKSDSSIIACYSQVNSEWSNNSIESNKFANTTSLHAIYSSADAAYKIDIKNNDIDTPSQFGVYLKFHPQNIRGNTVKSASGVSFYMDDALSGFVYYTDNTVIGGLDYAFTGFASSKSIMKDNKIIDCANGMVVSEGSVAENNYIEGCSGNSISMRRGSKASRNTIVATDNTTDGTDAIMNSDASTSSCVGNEIVSDGSFRYGITASDGIASVVIKNHFSGVFSESEIRNNGLTTLEYNTNEAGAIT